MGDIKVNVRIYGQDYTVSGERDEETILAIADYVDQKIREIGKFFTSSQPGSLATLAAVNMADELFSERERTERLAREKEQLTKDVKHYMDMWDEAKKNFVQYKEGANRTNDEMRELEEKCRRLEEKCSEFENAYFDLQMENIQLKDRIEKSER